MDILNPMPASGVETANSALEAELQSVQSEAPADQMGDETRFSSLIDLSATPPVEAVRQDLPPQLATYAAPVETALQTVQLQAASSGSDLQLDDPISELTPPPLPLTPPPLPLTPPPLPLTAPPLPVTPSRGLAQAALHPQSDDSSLPAGLPGVAPQAGPTSDNASQIAVQTTGQATDSGVDAELSDAALGTVPDEGRVALDAVLPRSDKAAETGATPSVAEVDVAVLNDSEQTGLRSPTSQQPADSEVMRPDVGQLLMRNGVGAAATATARVEIATEPAQSASVASTATGVGSAGALSSAASAAPTSSAMAPGYAATLAAVPLPLPLSAEGVPLTERQAGAWEQVVGQRLSRMAMQGAQEAQLQLDPPELGKLGVRVSLIGDEASVQFTSQHSAVRDLLESSTPRLREMLAEQGLDLVDVGVGTDAGQGGPFGQPGHGPESGDSSGAAALVNDTATASQERRPPPADDAVVDYYA